MLCMIKVRYYIFRVNHVYFVITSKYNEFYIKNIFNPNILQLNNGGDGVVVETQCLRLIVMNLNFKNMP